MGVCETAFGMWYVCLHAFQLSARSIVDDLSAFFLHHLIFFIFILTHTYTHMCVSWCWQCVCLRLHVIQPTSYLNDSIWFVIFANLWHFFMYAYLRPCTGVWESERASERVNDSMLCILYAIRIGSFHDSFSPLIYSAFTLAVLPTRSL